MYVQNPTVPLTQSVVKGTYFERWLYIMRQKEWPLQHISRNGRGVCGFRASIALVKFCFIFGPNDAEQKTPGFACYNFFLRAKNYRTHTTRAKNYRTHTTRPKNYRTHGHAPRTQNSRNAEGFWCASQQGYSCASLLTRKIANNSWNSWLNAETGSISLKLIVIFGNSCAVYHAKE